MPPPSRRRRAASVAAALCAIAVLLAGCGSAAPAAPAPGAGGDVVRVGSASFPENRVLAEIYAQGLERRGVRVERRFDTGNRETYFPALRDGSLDLVPEYTGNLLRYLAPDASAAGTPEQVYAQLASRVEAPLRVLRQAEAQNTDAVVVTGAFARDRGVRSIRDLARYCPYLTFGGPAEFPARPDGLPGLTRVYGCTFKEFRALDTGGPRTAAALRDGTVAAADLFSTDPAIPEGDLLVLEDPDANFAAQNIVPLVNGAVVRDGPMTDVLDRISQRLDTPTLASLNERFAGTYGHDARRLAGDWLTENGIV